MNDLKYAILINKSQKQFTDRGFECILAVVLTLTTLWLLMFFPILGIALSLFASCFLCVGTKKYLLCVSRDKFMPILFIQWPRGEASILMTSLTSSRPLCKFAATCQRYGGTKRLRRERIFMIDS